MDIIESPQIVKSNDEKYFNQLSTQSPINSDEQQNLLIDAASRIFASNTQLKHSSHYHDIKLLREYLLNEISLFNQNSKKFEYDDDLILIGQYAVSATLDETISKTAWGNKANWEKFNLLQELQENLNADEHFFVLLERISHKPSVFIDAIELMYICLSLGFEGKYKHHPLEKQNLRQITDYTYEVIRQYRGEFEKKLTPSVDISETKQKSEKKRQNIPVLSIIVLSCFILFGMYLGFNQLLKISADQTNQQLQNIMKGS